MKARFQADADFNFTVLQGIRRREPAIDFRSAQEALRDGTDDALVLEIAASDGRILVSHDVTTMPAHFTHFLAAGKRSPGVILAPQAMPISESIEQIVLIWAASDAAEWEGRLTFLPL